MKAPAGSSEEIDVRILLSGFPSAFLELSMIELLNRIQLLSGSPLPLLSSSTAGVVMTPAFVSV